MKTFVCLIAILFYTVPAFPNTITNGKVTYMVPGTSISYLEDADGKLTFSDVLTNGIFQRLNQPIANFSSSRSVFWLRFEVLNNTESKLFLEIGNPLLNEIEVYSGYYHQDFIKAGVFGNHFPFQNRLVPINTYLVDPLVNAGESKIIYLKIKSTEPVEVPITLGTIEAFLSLHHKVDFFEGLYFGFVVLILLYNLFLFFTVKERIYLYYVIYVVGMLFMMAHFKGYTFEYLWPDNAEKNKYFSIIYSFGSFSGIVFSIKFLKSKLYTPVLYNFTYVFLLVFTASVILNFAGFHFESNLIEMMAGMTGCVYVLALGISAYYKGNKSAKYHILAFGFIVAGAFITVIYYLNLIPHHALFANAVLIGSAMELLFLSLALADKINNYKTEIANAQAIMIQQLKENEKLKDQLNKELEAMVLERTKELKEKKAQIDLLFYKASHDIKGPLRSITSLAQMAITDFDDNVRTKIYLQNIFNASTNVSNKVTELLELAKLKETRFLFEEIKVKEMIDEILISLQNLPEYSRMSFDISVENNLMMVSDKKAVFSVLQNIIENAIKYNDPSKEKSVLKINISKSAKNYLFVFEDNGIGVPANKKEKIFDMFYKVNEKSIGSGMGLHIVKETIKKMGGNIEVNSEEKVGTSFVISIPVSNNVQLSLQQQMV